MAASLLAMNEVFGRFFDVDPIEMFEPAAYAQSGAPRDLFVFDDQLHMVRGSRRGAGGALRALAQGPSSARAVKRIRSTREGLPDERGDVWGVWNPALVGLPIDPANVQIVQFIKDVYLDSQVTIGLLSNVTASSVTGRAASRARAPRNVEEALRGEILTAAQTAAARNFVNEISGSTRMLAHGLLYVGKGNLAYIQEQIEKNQPDSWKGYNISNAAKVDNDPDSLMRQWRHDDEEVAYPTFELIEKNYEKLKGTKPGLQQHLRAQGAGARTAGSRARPSRRHAEGREGLAEPELHHLSRLHSAGVLHVRLAAGGQVRKAARRRARHQLDDRVRQLWSRRSENCYAEIGTTWASSVVTFPTVAAHIMGQLMKFMGPDRIVFGSDSVWYGSPQWQIDAMWRFQIPEEMRKKYGYPELTERREAQDPRPELREALRHPATSARSYKPVPKDYESRMSNELKTMMEFPVTARQHGEVQRRVRGAGAEPSQHATAGCGPRCRRSVARGAPPLAARWLATLAWGRSSFS